MATGKYAARAANRAAALDNEVIADLRAKLAAAQTERDRLAGELEAQRRRATGEVNRRVDAAMAAERAATVTAREREAVELAQWKHDVAADVIEVAAAWVRGLRNNLGDDAEVIPASMFGPTDTEGPNLLRVLGMLLGEDTGGMGAVINYILDPRGERPPAVARTGRYLGRRSVAKRRDAEFALRIEKLGAARGE